MSVSILHRARARRATPGPPPHVEHDPEVVGSYLSDAAHVPDGRAAGVAFPATVDELAAIVASSDRVLAIGAQSSLTGGATPRGDVIVSTRRLTRLEEPHQQTVRAGAGVPLTDLQRWLAARGLYYPPVPTFEGAFVGGTIATNAAGAATFKYGSTRRWVEALTIVLADGSILDLRRGEVCASADGWFELERVTGDVVRFFVPTYTMPAVPKLSAGYFAAPQMDLVDLFVGSEGTLGIVAEAVLRTIARPELCTALIECDSESRAVSLAGLLRNAALLAWQGQDVLDIAAIEYIDANSIALLDRAVFDRAGLPRPAPEATLLLAQLEVGNLDDALTRLREVLDRSGVAGDPILALPGDERGAGRLVELREAVPAAVNARVAAAKGAVHPGIQKTAGDLIVPFDRLQDSLTLYRSACERRGLAYAVWGHVSDGNLHPNVIPRSLDEVARGVEALREMAQGVTAMGGAPLAEHGVGRSALKQSLLAELYGRRGVDEMRAVKRALDPACKLAPGVVFPEITLAT